MSTRKVNVYFGEPCVSSWSASAWRLAPDAAFAPKAYDLLVETIEVGFSRSAAAPVPEELGALLTELRQLITAARAPKS